MSGAMAPMLLAHLASSAACEAERKGGIKRAAAKRHRLSAEPCTGVWTLHTERRTAPASCEAEREGGAERAAAMRRKKRSSSTPTYPQTPDIGLQERTAPASRAACEAERDGGADRAAAMRRRKRSSGCPSYSTLFQPSSPCLPGVCRRLQWMLNALAVANFRPAAAALPRAQHS